MHDTRGGVGRWLAILLALGAISGYLILRWAPGHTLLTFSARVESNTNQTLARLGITDYQILQQLHREHRRFGLVWIESERRIQLLTAADVSRVARSLVSTGRQEHCRARQRMTSQGTLVTISFLGMSFQKVWLVAGGKAALRPQIAIVIDDVAYDPAPMDRFAKLGIPLTFAILPRDRRSKMLADKADALHFPVLLHLPMEPEDRMANDPGPSALYLSMTPQQLKNQFEKNLASVPHVVGINNHMGSAFTADEAKMKLIMPWVKQKGFFFLDSHTTSNSVVARVARQAGVPCLLNETFLDNQDDAVSIEKQLDHAMRLALRDKRTIAISHYGRKHLAEALEKRIPEFQAHGVAFVPLTAFFNR
ncbi:MAG: divergent polysaccharide deacetylase family protein [Elusimicrobiota bacterium]|jgi:hypothetical protein